MKDFSEPIDRRTKASRRWHSLFSEFLAARGTIQGRHSIADRNAAKMCATLTLLLEKMDAQILRGESVNPEAYSRTANSLGRFMHSLGISQWKEEPEPKKPTLSDVLNQKKEPPTHE